MSSVVTDGKDGQELKLKTIGPTFLYFKAMPRIACVQTLPSAQKKVWERGPLSPLISEGRGASVHRLCLPLSAKELPWLVFLEEIRLVSSS